MNNQYTDGKPTLTGNLLRVQYTGMQYSSQQMSVCNSRFHENQHFLLCFSARLRPSLKKQIRTVLVQYLTSVRVLKIISVSFVRSQKVPTVRKGTQKNYFLLVKTNTLVLFWCFDRGAFRNLHVLYMASQYSTVR